MPRVRYAQSAQDDLLDAWLFIAKDSLAAADRVLDTIEREADTLSGQPLMGRARPELGKKCAAGPRLRPTFCFTCRGKPRESQCYAYCTMHEIFNASNSETKTIMDIARYMRQIGHQAHASTAAKDTALLAMAQAIREHVHLMLIDDAEKGLEDLAAGRTRNARSALTKRRAKRFAG